MSIFAGLVVGIVGIIGLILSVPMMLFWLVADGFDWFCAHKEA